MQDAKAFKIDRVGTYKTRKGETTKVYTTGSWGNFPVRGSVQKGKRMEPNAWTLNGKVMAVGDSPDDIVEFVG